MANLPLKKTKSGEVTKVFLKYHNYLLTNEELFQCISSQLQLKNYTIDQFVFFDQILDIKYIPTSFVFITFFEKINLDQESAEELFTIKEYFKAEQFLELRFTKQKLIPGYRVRPHLSFINSEKEEQEVLSTLLRRTFSDIKKRPGDKSTFHLIISSDILRKFWLNYKTELGNEQ